MSKGGISRSIAMKLSSLAREKGVPFEKILTEFLIERMLVRLVISPQIGTAFIFKGGYVGRRAYGSPRYTVDLDALTSISHSSHARVRNVENRPSLGRFSTRTAATATHRVSALRGAPKRSLSSRFARAIRARTSGHLT